MMLFWLGAATVAQVVATVILAYAYKFDEPGNALLGVPFLISGASGLFFGILAMYFHDRGSR